MSASLHETPLHTRARAVVHQAIREMDRNGFYAGMSLLQTVLAQQPNDFRLLREFAHLLAKGGHYASALQWLEYEPARTAAGFPYLLYAELLDHVGRHGDAFDALLAGPADLPERELRLARLEIKLGDGRAALRRLDAIPQPDGSHVHCRVNALAQTGRLMEAAELQAAGLGLACVPTPGTAPREGGLQINMVCWGRPVVEAFLGLALPNQFTRGNLPDIADQVDLHYCIHTDAGSVDLLQQHPSMAALRTVASVEIHAFPVERIQPGAVKYELANQCHRHAVLTANQHRRTLVFLAPDALISEGCFAQLLQWQREGRTNILCSGPRITRETALPALEALARRGDFKGVRTFGTTSRDVSRAVIEHLHPCMQGTYADSGYTDTWSCLYTAVGSDGVIARQLHLHPLLVTPENRSLLPEGTIDIAYVGEACPRREGLYVVEDSDELAACSWSDRSENADMRRHREAPCSKAQIVAHLARRHLEPFNLELVTRRMRFHTEDLDERWLVEEQRSDALVAELLAELAARPFDRYNTTTLDALLAARHAA